MGRFTLGSHWQDATIGSAAVRLRQHIGIVPEILPRRIMIPAGVFVVAFAHRVRKPDDAFFIDIADEATASTAVGATDLAPVTVFLEMKLYSLMAARIFVVCTLHFCTLIPGPARFAVQKCNSARCSRFARTEFAIRSVVNLLQ